MTGWRLRGTARPEDLVEDRLELEVDVVAGDVELDRGDLAGLRALVDRLDELLELVAPRSRRPRRSG